MCLLYVKEVEHAQYSYITHIFSLSETYMHLLQELELAEKWGKEKINLFPQSTPKRHLEGKG